MRGEVRGQHSYMRGEVRGQLKNLVDEIFHKLTFFSPNRFRMRKSRKQGGKTCTQPMLIKWI